MSFIAALPRGGATGIDIFVSNPDGSRTLAIQVKTSDWAMRTRGRGQNEALFELQFPVGNRSAKINNPNLMFAFVDLNGLQGASLPDV